MTRKQEWSELTSAERMRLLVAKPIGDLIHLYQREGSSEATFNEELREEVSLWQPTTISEVEEVRKVPTKDVVLGAWRDLDRAEAIMELIDNSIDAWNARREMHPNKCPKGLSVSIEMKDGRLIYEDNAGGIPVEKLAHLVIPGYSDTKDLSRTIGSYRTGGKKAVFRLGVAALILTRYWDPTETQDQTIAVQLDRDWIEDSQEYAFPFARLKGAGGISKGATRYVLQLRKEDVEPNPWYENPKELGKVSRQITNAYTLLLIRNPAISIRIGKLLIKPNLDLYDFSGWHKEGVDIRPQQVKFHTALEHQGQKHPIEIELVLGCRTSTGVKGDRGSGIDLYGNDRLFVSYDQDVFADLLPSGNSRLLARGFLNIKAPNVFIPWDTHKRHLNVDREVVRHMTKNKLITEIFGRWNKVYRAISRLGSGEVTTLIQDRVRPVLSKSRRDMNIPHRDEVTIDLSKNRGASLPEKVHTPQAPMAKKEDALLKVPLTLNQEEARAVFAYYGGAGEPTKQTMKDLADSIKEELLEWVEGVKHV